MLELMPPFYFLTFAKVSVSVSKKFGLKKVSVSVSKTFGLEKKSWYRSRKHLVSKKSLGIGLENIWSQKKSLGISLEKIWSQKKSRYRSFGKGGAASRKSKWERVINPNPPAIASRLAPGSGPAPLGRRFKDRAGQVAHLSGGQVVRAGKPPAYQERRPHSLKQAIEENVRVLAEMNK